MYLFTDEALHLKTAPVVGAIQMPDSPAAALQPQKIIAEGLLNPRGICRLDDGSLLVAEAGSGRADAPNSGRISRLRPDRNSPGHYLSAESVFSGFRSMNMQSRMHRDEIMGVSDIAVGDGRCVLSVTDYVRGSGLLDMQHMPEPIFHSRGNLNSLCYHPERDSWLAVKPDQDVLVEFSRSAGEQVIAEFPKYPQGQDAVPVTLVYEPSTGAVLVSLFSGELHKNPLLKGMDFEERAGKVVRVWPDSGEIETVITGLQFPTGIALQADGRLLVLELCDRLLEPLTQEWSGETRHGGYERFSGRLLEIDLQSGEATVLATQLDTPSNLCLLPDNAALVSEGMGLTGRPVPTPTKKVEKLTGRIRRVELNGLAY